VGIGACTLWRKKSCGQACLESERELWELEHKELTVEARDQIVDAVNGLHNLIQCYNIPLFHMSLGLVCLSRCVCQCSRAIPRKIQGTSIRATVQDMHNFQCKEQCLCQLGECEVIHAQKEHRRDLQQCTAPCMLLFILCNGGRKACFSWCSLRWVNRQQPAISPSRKRSVNASYDHHINRQAMGKEGNRG